MVDDDECVFLGLYYCCEFCFGVVVEVVGWFVEECDWCVMELDFGDCDEYGFFFGEFVDMVIEEFWCEVGFG